MEESKDVNSMRVDKLVGFQQTYEMTLPDSQKPKEFAFLRLPRVKKKKINYEKIGKNELAHFTKQVKEAMKFYRRANRKQDSGKSKKSKKILKK